MTHPLTEKQKLFFERQKQAIIRLDAGMQGALQMIIEEMGLKGRVRLSDDCTEVIEEEPPESKLD